ncbi:putative galactinol--sucrose galactosyltransferase 6 [Colletotrichum siamense]|uniref:Galactinol--sucrose galactosyltransferase 6 n=1 Tax=Colletotrichum siamense TaxID=690259 RepID=A0A9P5K9T5_COLSI|nr:putative galactinol--sucrose galactosyltransferase 6 [Colletotrichum siamense]KAF4865345.1 putative galactinol--sucrose galactosyltransferase 6 [Colletotrichum siamense]
MPSDNYNFVDEFQKLFVSKQKPAPEPITDNMKAIIQSYPPLGQFTQVSTGQLTVTAVLEIPASRADEPWEVALWHSIDGGEEWAEVALRRIPDADSPTTLQAVPDHVRRFFFSASLSINKTLQFTLKFRHSDADSWRWTRDELGVGDGNVVVSTAPVLQSVSERLEDIVTGFNPAWNVKSLMSQCPGTRLWSLETGIDAVDDDESKLANISLGMPWGSFQRWFALVRIWSPWLAPRHGKTSFHLDKDAVLCSFLSSEGKHLVFLAVSGVNNVLSVFRHDDAGQISVHARNDGSLSENAKILVAIGDNFESANAAVMYQARHYVITEKKASNELQAEMKAIEEGVKPEWMENWYDGLGFCTWNALGQRLTDEKVFDAVDKLAENNIKVTSLIIDDNWQTIDYRGHGQFQHGWCEFEAEPKAFPKGLKATVAHIREKHPHIQHIAVWHALLGYWAGISPDGKIAKEYKTVEIVREDAERRNLPLGGKMTVVAKEDVDKFYNDFYKFLVDCGIDGVKTDAQFMTDTWVSATARRELIDAYLDAWTISSLRHFSIKAISCMSQTPQILFYNQLPRSKPAILCRNSDDFFPEIPASHPWHVWTNAHNSLLTQHLNILPDWDMFQTVHDYSGFHAAARCVSGGPIYITDVPGQHNLDLIKQMTGLTIRGKTVIFRPSVIGKTIDPYTGYDDDGLLKIGCYHGKAVTGTPILGVFNISARSLTEIIPLSSFAGVLPSMRYVVRAHSSGKVSSPVTPGTPASALTTSVDVRGYEIFTAYPLSSFDSESKGKVWTANLGLVGKMTGAAAIVNSDFLLRHDGKVELKTRLKALGVLGLYISKLPELTIHDDFLVTIQNSVIPVSAVSVCKNDDKVLEIDIEKAWEEMGLHPGWSNEVEMTVTFAIDHEQVDD